MPDPYASQPLDLTEADRALWATYERANARSVRMYRDLPISLGAAGRVRPCRGCGRLTVSRYGTCRHCLRGDE